MTTLKKVAEKAGVSTAAASAALSGREGTIGVAAKTRERILRIAAESGYRPNPLAASLRTGRTKAIGICLREPEAYLAHPQGARNFWTMCEIAGRHGYRISLLTPSSGDIDSRGMDGCLVMNDDLNGPLVAQLKRLVKDIPVVSLARPYPWAIPVNEDRSWHRHRRLAAEYLYNLGHRSIAIAHLDRPSQAAIVDQFREVADELGLVVSVEAAREPGFDRRYLSIDPLLALDPMPTAFFAIDDDYARALISRLHRKGIRVPDQVSVFSGSTGPGPHAMWPALTGLLLHFERELEQLFSEFVRIIEGERKRTPIDLGSFDVELVERESCSTPCG